MSIGYLWKTTKLSQVECGPIKTFCWNVDNGEKLLHNPIQTINEPGQDVDKTSL